ncbi:MAG: hypothetical protein PHO03_05675 [Candidatus Omnitrophica bacterium]|nr:hypothetical protein [Candidatus Omnitrophota bacterium]
MAWHAVLGKLLAKISPKINLDVKNPIIINKLNVHITNIDNNQDVNYDPEKNTCNINLKNLEQNLKKEILSLDLLEEERILLQDKCKDTIEEFRSQEKLAETQERLRFLDKKIPLEDLNIWRAALYLRHCYTTKGLKQKVGAIKYQIMQKFGDKGRNIANLCTAGYLEEWLMPAYEKLKETLADEDLAKLEFGKIYSNLVNQLPFTIFVSHVMSRDELKKEILRRKEFGIAFVNIHAIGDINVLKVKAVTVEIEKEREHCDEVKKHHIFVRIYFKDTGETKQTANPCETPR